MDKVSLYELVFCLSDVLDLISDEVKDHHRRVSWAAYHLAEAMNVDEAKKRNIVIASALHDIGGLSLNDRLSTLFGFEDSTFHAEKGYRLLSVFEPFCDIAAIIRYHHTLWDYGKAVNASADASEERLMGSQIVLMADRIAVMLKPGIHILNHVNGIKEIIVEQENRVYSPELVAAFKRVAQKDSFWLDIISQALDDLLAFKLKTNDIYFSDSHLTGIMELMSSIIDFRSFFTATHSKGVSVVAEELSRLMEFSESDCMNMRIAGLLHDIGKLAVPMEILEKNGALNEYERDIIRTHAYYTDKVISRLSGAEIIKEWASFHHEGVNGKGYPFGLNYADLSAGSKIMKVSDIFVALMEDRPYRKSMGVEKAMGIMNCMTEKSELDPKAVSVLSDNLDMICKLLYREERKAHKHYMKFLEGLDDQ